MMDRNILGLHHVTAIAGGILIEQRLPPPRLPGGASASAPPGASGEVRR